MNAVLRDQMANPGNRCDGCGQPVPESAFCGVCANDWEAEQAERNGEWFE